MTDVSVLIPWRNDHGPRERILDWNILRWRALLPLAEIGTWGAEGEPFNRGAARNNAVEHSRGDILVLADADTTVPARSSIIEAIEWAQEGHWVLPYTTYFNLTEANTKQILRMVPDVEFEYPPQHWEFRLEDSVSGVIVMPREAFEAVGGYDEHFIGWGFEDRAFAVALETMWGPCRRLESYLLHLWHPVGPEDAFGNPSIYDNQGRWLQYQAAAGNRRSMEDLVRR